MQPSSPRRQILLWCVCALGPLSVQLIKEFADRAAISIELVTIIMEKPAKLLAGILVVVCLGFCLYLGILAIHGQLVSGSSAIREPPKGVSEPPPDCVRWPPSPPPIWTSVVKEPPTGR